MADRFGWTLAYIDALPSDEAVEIIDIVLSSDRAQAHNARYHK